MKSSRARLLAIRVLLLLVLPSISSCAYLQNRGGDALDVFDVGVTFSQEPSISAYAGFLNVLSLGYSNVDEGTILGIGGREVGAIPMRHNTWGILVYGREQLAYGSGFDPADPNSPEPWAAGIFALPDGPKPPPGQTVNCPKLLHLGWVGLTLNCRFGELGDFVLGWTTLDIMGDDTAG